MAELLAGLEQQILSKVLQAVSGPGGPRSCAGTCWATG
jgi:hypothetical protein